MKKDYVLQIGIDWSDQKHDYCLCEKDTAETQAGILPHDPAVLHGWIEQLRKCYPQGRIEVCLETNEGPLVEILRSYDYIDLYPVNPLTVRRFRESLYPSLSKDDPEDARILLELLCKHRNRLRKMPVVDARMRLLDGLVQARRERVQTRTKAVQKLIASLKGYYPQALQLSGTVGERMSLDFLRKWPSWQSLQKVRPSTLRKFYHAQRCRSKSLIEQRLSIHATSVALTRDAVTVELGMLAVKSLVGQIEVLNQAIRHYDECIRQTYAQLEQKSLCDSFPGAGEVLAPRLAVAMGCHALMCQSAQDLAAYSGVAPLRQRSGNMLHIAKRMRIPKFLHQTFVEYAQWSVSKSPWAKAFYHHRRYVLKQKRWSVLRALALKWIRIIFRCWQTQTPYNEQLYIASLKNRGSPLAKAL